MNLTPIFFGTVTAGKLTLNDDKAFKQHIASFEGAVQLTLKKKKNQRSMRQNSYYWGVVVNILASHFGYEPDEMHEALKFQFLRAGDVRLPTVRSTAELNTAEFEDLMSRIRRWAAMEFQINIPEPNEDLLLS